MSSQYYKSYNKDIAICMHKWETEILGTRKFLTDSDLKVDVLRQMGKTMISICMKAFGDHNEMTFKIY